MANEAERQRWNDEGWARVWPQREALTDLVTPLLLDSLALQRGERVLDIGCGGGKTSVAAARVVGPTGAVDAVDISKPLLALARERVQRAGVTNVRFLLADAQTDRLGDRYDAATSQFGVMFFDESRVAFANIGSQLRPGGRLVFACWQPIERNPWFVGRALSPYVQAPPAAAEGKNPTGPFTLGDPGLVDEILTAAGFAEIRITQHELISEAPAEAIIDRDQLPSMGVRAEELAAANTAIDDHLAQFRDLYGLCHFPLALQVVSARLA